MKSIIEIEQEICDEFALFSDWMEKYEYLIDLGKGLKVIDESDKNEGTLINGCQSRVWLGCENLGGCLFFKADSDAIITRGMIALLLRVFDGQTPEAILCADLSFIDKIGLKENLSPTRANGLVSMIKKILDYAAAFRS